jgi:hypothetical protein
MIILKTLGMNKSMIIFFIVVGVGALFFYSYKNLFFTGSFDKKYTREELTQNFVKHENDFYNLATFFNEKVSKNKELKVSFGLGKGNKVNLILSPLTINLNNKIIGGENIEFDSPTLDSALAVLGWTNETLKHLREKLSKTNCDWIRTTEINSNPVEVYPNQKGWSSFSYQIFDVPISDSLKQIHGKPISNIEFGSKVVLKNTSAL